METRVTEMRELAERVKRMAEAEGTSVEHVLVVLTTVLLAPQNTPSVTAGGGDSSPVKGAPRENEKEDIT